MHQDHIHVYSGSNDREHHRNHKCLRRVDKTLLTSLVCDDETGSTEQAEENVKPPDESESANTMTQEPARTLRSRVVKKPARYHDFVKL